MPSSGKAAARTALPQPPKTSQKVPKSSAKYLGSRLADLHLVLPNEVPQLCC